MVHLVYAIFTTAGSPDIEIDAEEVESVSDEELVDVPPSRGTPPSPVDEDGVEDVPELPPELALLLSLWPSYEKRRRPVPALLLLRSSPPAVSTKVPVGPRAQTDSPVVRLLVERINICKSQLFAGALVYRFRSRVNEPELWWIQPGEHSVCARVVIVDADADLHFAVPGVLV